MSCSYGKIQLQIMSSIHWYGLSGPNLHIYKISCKGENLFSGHPVLGQNLKELNLGDIWLPLQNDGTRVRLLYLTNVILVVTGVLAQSLWCHNSCFAATPVSPQGLKWRLGMADGFWKGVYTWILPSSVPVGQFQLRPIWTEICIISDNYHPPTPTRDSSEQTT